MFGTGVCSSSESCLADIMKYPVVVRITLLTVRQCHNLTVSLFLCVHVVLTGEDSEPAMDRHLSSTSSGVEHKSSSRGHLGIRSPEQSDTRSRRRTSRRRADTIDEYYRDMGTADQTDYGDSVPPASTITLVRVGCDTAVTPMLPPFSRTNTLDVPLWDESMWSSSSRAGQQQSSVELSGGGPIRPHHTPHLSPVPLTPRPTQQSREDSAHSLATAHTSTSASRISPLPTPNFAARTGLAVRAYFPRLTSLVSSEAATADARPPHPRNKSSCYSTASGGSTAVDALPPSEGEADVGAARPTLPPSFSTTDRLTRKFPRPRSVKKLAMGKSSGHAALAATMLEEGEGWGIGSVDRWSVHKWCLLLSVSTLLVYGLAGLVCAVLTWFRST